MRTPAAGGSTQFALELPHLSAASYREPSVALHEVRQLQCSIIPCFPQLSLHIRKSNHNIVVSCYGICIHQSRILAVTGCHRVAVPIEESAHSSPPRVSSVALGLDAAVP